MPGVTIIIPVRNESGAIPALAAELSAAMDASGWRWEALWVDDASKDGTTELLRSLCRADPRHKLLRFSRRRGQSAAWAQGAALARYEILATMDGDGQNDPADLPRLLRRLAADRLDMVSGYREDRKDPHGRLRVSRWGNVFRRWMTGERTRDAGCSIRVLHRDCLRGIPFEKGMHRYMTTVSRINGRRRMAEVPVSHRPRLHGRSNYGTYSRLPNVLWVGLRMRFLLWSRGLRRPTLACPLVERRRTQEPGLSAA